MKKLSAVLAVVACIAIIFAVVFGVQKGNLQNDMKKAADEAAAKLTEAQNAAKTAADEAAAKLAEAEAAAKTAADEAAAKLAETEAPSEAALPSKFTRSETFPLGATPSTTSVYGVSVNTWERTLLDTVTSIWKLSDIMIFLSPETLLIPQTMFHVFPMASGISKFLDVGESKLPLTELPSSFAVAVAKNSRPLASPTVTSGRADFERPSTPSSVPPKPRPSKAFAYEAGRAPGAWTLPLKVMN